MLEPSSVVVHRLAHGGVSGDRHRGLGPRHRHRHRRLLHGSQEVGKVNILIEASL